MAAFNVDVLVGALNGHFLGIALVTALLALAVSAAAHGLGHLGGPIGIVAAVLLLLLLGVSSAGGAVTYQFEPGFYGAVSQLLPPGAALTAVRNVQYFDWAATLAAAGRPRGVGRRRRRPWAARRAHRPARQGCGTSVSRRGRRSSDRWFPRLSTERVSGAARRSMSGGLSQLEAERDPRPARRRASSRM